MNLSKNLILLIAIAIVGVCGADNSSSNSVVAGVIKKKISNHLHLIRHETFANAISALRVGGRKLEGHTTTDGDTFRMLKKRAKAAKSKSAKATLFTTFDDVQAKLDTCEAELDAYKASANAPHWLFVQMADMCVLYRDSDGIYHLESSNFHKDTEWFSDRPMQLEKTEPTSDWFNNFNEMFDDGNGMPNAALTIVDDYMSKDVVVSIFAEGYVKVGEGDNEGVTTYGYKLEQSTDQKSVMALESLIEDGKDSVTFDHCSMFIDL